jgi:hypothetical protein
MTNFGIWSTLGVGQNGISSNVAFHQLLHFYQPHFFNCCVRPTLPFGQFGLLVNFGIWPTLVFINSAISPLVAFHQLLVNHYICSTLPYCLICHLLFWPFGQLSHFIKLHELCPFTTMA